MMNIINGGAHADNSVDIQEFMILPLGAPSFSEAVRYGAEVFHTLKKVLHAKGLNTAVGDEGGFAPDLPSNEAAHHHDTGSHRQSRLPRGQGHLSGPGCCQHRSSTRMAYTISNRRAASSIQPNSPTIWPRLAAKYPIVTIEDGMSEGDWDGWAILTRKLGSKVQLVGDDIFVTNTKIFAEGIARKIANAILIKPNQIGTLTETLAAIDMAFEGEIRGDHFAPLGGNRGCHHRGYCRRDDRDADQDRLHVALGPHRQIQSAVADRRRSWEPKPLMPGCALYRFQFLKSSC